MKVKKKNQYGYESANCQNSILEKMTNNYYIFSRDLRALYTKFKSYMLHIKENMTISNESLPQISNRWIYSLNVVMHQIDLIHNASVIF